MHALQRLPLAAQLPSQKDSARWTRRYKTARLLSHPIAGCLCIATGFAAKIIPGPIGSLLALVLIMAGVTYVMVAPLLWHSRLERAESFVAVDKEFLKVWATEPSVSPHLRDLALQWLNSDRVVTAQLKCWFEEAVLAETQAHKPRRLVTSSNIAKRGHTL
jgi:hypothetical protein